MKRRLLFARCSFLAAGLCFVLRTAFHKSDGASVVLLGRYAPKVFTALVVAVACLIWLAWFTKTKRFEQCVYSPSIKGKLTALVFSACAFLLISFPLVFFYRIFWLREAFWGACVFLLIGQLACLPIEAVYREFHRNKRTVFLSAALMSVSVLLTLLVMEVGVRVWLAQHPSERRVYDPRTYSERDHWTFERHHYLNYQLKSDYTSSDGLNRHNSLSFRDGDEISIPKPTDEYRIVTLGGSTTYDRTLNLDWRESYSAQLEEILVVERGFKNVRVVNAGVPGYNSWESLVNLAFKVLDLEPDMIIIYHGVNDVNARLTAPGNYQADNSGKRRQWDDSEFQKWKYRVPSALWLFSGYRLGFLKTPGLNVIVNNSQAPKQLPTSDEFNLQLGTTPAEALKRNSPKHFERNIRNMIAMARANGVETTLMTFVYYPEFHGRESYSSTEWFRDAIQEFNGILEKLSVELNTEFVDLRELLPIKREYFRDDVHFTKEGNRVRAEIVANHLVTQGVFPENN